MTRIDRYILVLFLRTVVIGFLSISGIFIVFHAFTSMDRIAKTAAEGESMAWVMLRFYGPYMLLLFDWTAAIIALMAAMFTVGVLRRTGELTSTLAAGICHGRIFRPMIFASIGIVAVQAINREWVLPQYRHVLKMKSRDIGSDGWQEVTAKYDKVRRILVDGERIRVSDGQLTRPQLRVDGNYPGFGDMIIADNAYWESASGAGSGEVSRPSGFRLVEVRRPDGIDQMASVFWKEQPVLLTSRDVDWLADNEMFLCTTVSPDLLVTNVASTRRASIWELARYIDNPAVHSPLSLKVLFHERMLRPLLDVILVTLGLPLMVNRHGRNVFVMMAAAMLTVLAFFAIKTLTGALGGSGYMMTPALAAWMPILIMGPIAYMRYQEVQTV